MASALHDERPTLLILGEGEPMVDAIRQSLHRRGIATEVAETDAAVQAVTAAAPDLAILVGDAVRDRGEAVLRELAVSAVASVVPVALLLDDASLDDRLQAFRSGAVAVVPRTASTHEIAERVAQLAKELPNRPGEAAGELGEATLDELVALVTRELRSGILSVEGGDEGVRLVLGAGGPVAEALDHFVARLRPLIEKAEPLRYELLETSGGRLRLLDADEHPKADVTLLGSLRLLLMDNDPGRADGLAQALRAHGALVGVTEASARGLARARGLDPSVVVLDAATIEGAGFEAVRKIRRDPRLRWAGLLVAPWDEIWPKGSAAPDIEELAGRIAPLVEHDRALKLRAEQEDSFDTRLELTGPGRMLRALASLPGTRHLSVRGPQATLELDVGDDLVIGATAKVNEQEVEGTAALSILLALGSGRVHVERRQHPATATVMTPVDQALDAAAKSVSVGPSQPPAPMLSPAGDGAKPGKPKSGPFPSASELKAGVAHTPDVDPDPSGPLLRPSDRAATRETSAQTGAAISDEMVWEGGKLKSQITGEVDPDPHADGDADPDEAERKRVALATTMVGKPPRKKTMFGVGAPPRPHRPAKATPHVPMEAVTDKIEESRAADEHDRPTVRPSAIGVEEEEERITQDLDVGDLESVSIPSPPRTPNLDLPGVVAPPEPPVVAPAPPVAPAQPPSAIPSEEVLRSLAEETDIIAVPGVSSSRTPWLAAGAIVLLGALGAAAYFLLPGLLGGSETDPTLTSAGIDAGPAVSPTADSGVADAGASGTDSGAGMDAGFDAGFDAGTDAAAEGAEDAATEAVAVAGLPSEEELEGMDRRERRRLSERYSTQALDAIDDDPARVPQLLAQSEAYDPTNPQMMAGRARFALASEDTDVAIQWAERALRAKPRRAAYMVLLADALRVAGNRSRSRRYYRRALEVEPGNRQARRGLRAL